MEEKKVEENRIWCLSFGNRPLSLLLNSRDGGRYLKGDFSVPFSLNWFNGGSLCLILTKRQLTSFGN